MQCAYRVKKDDQVEVIAGKDKGRVGKILKIDSAINKAIVEKINMVKRHTKPNQANQQGGIIDKEELVTPTNKKPRGKPQGVGKAIKGYGRAYMS